MDILQDVSADAGTEQVPFLIDPTNYALDKNVVARINDEKLTLIPQIRNIRKTIQDRWTRFRQCYNGEHNRKLYEGRSDLYWRIAYKIVETFVSHIKTQVFPTVDSFYIEPSPFDPFSVMLAPLISRLLRHDIEQARVERHLDTFLRTGLIEGVSVVKEGVWSVRRVNQIQRMPFMMPFMGGGMPSMGPMPSGPAGPGTMGGNVMGGLSRQPSMPMGPTAGPGIPGLMSGFGSNLITYEGPTFIPIRNLDFYVHPQTVTDIDDADMVFEDIYVSKTHLLAMAKAGKYQNVDAVFATDGGNKIIPQTAGDKDLQRLREGVTEQLIQSVSRDSYVLQEIWTTFDFDGSGYVVPAKIVVCNGIVLEARQNPLFSQRAPYRAWHCVDKPGSFYSTGIVEPIEHLNIAANAIGNQMLDAVAMQTNHILGVNVALLAQDVSALRIAPRAIWPTLGPPDEVFQEFRPPDNTQAAMASLQLLSGAMQDIAGAPPLLQGKFSNTEKTATEISATATGAQAALDGFVRNVETHVMSPMLYDWYVLEQQFRAVESTVKITGSLPMKIDPQDLVGNYGFRWMTSTQVPPLIAQLQQQAQAMMAMAMGAGAQQRLGPGGGAPGQQGPRGQEGGPNAKTKGAAVPTMPSSLMGPPPAMGLGTQPSMGL